MNIDERIERRLGVDARDGGITNLDAVSPVTHPDSPTGRGPHVERVLDALDPAFAGSLPPSLYVYGPKGTGKSAVVTALFARLSAHGGRRRQAILTTTRAADPTLPEFVHVDGRIDSTRFGVYQTALRAVTDEHVPDHGIGTEDLAADLRATVTDGTDLVVAVDHVAEPGTPDAATVAGWLDDVSDRIVTVCLGRASPTEIGWTPERDVEFDPYHRHELVEVVTARVSAGLARDALTHDQVREVAEWADGDAHDALAAVTGAAIHAEGAGASTIRGEDLDAGIDAVPKPCVSLGRVLALPENRQRVLYELIRLSEADRQSVGAATTAISEAAAVDLSESTVRRVVYELADVGILDRITAEHTSGKGRPPSRLEPRFPTLVFRELFERG